MDKVGLQGMYMDFLKESGYESELKDGGDVRFNYQNHWLTIGIFDDDLEYGVIGNITPVGYNENNNIASLVYNVASIVNGDCKLTKIYIDENSEKELYIFVEIGYLLDDFEIFKKHFDRMANEIIDSLQLFHTIMRYCLNNQKSNSTSVIEEKIRLRKHGRNKYLTYTLSNNIDEIKQSIYEKMGIDIGDISEPEWEINTELSQKVKDVMEKHGVVYSATLRIMGSNSLNIAINRKVGDTWYFCDGFIFNRDFYSRYKLKQLRK